MENWDKTEPTKFDSFTGTWKITDNTLVNRVWTALIRMLRWTIAKYIFTAIFVVILSVGFGYSAKDKKLAEDMASKAAYNNPKGMFDDFIKSKNPKIKLTNNHPLYNSSIVKGWEKEFNLKFSSIFQYITIDVDGNKEDLIVMKKAAFRVDDENMEVVKLELSTMISDSADDVCESFFGDVPTEYQKTYFDRKRHWTIRKIKDELTQENDDGEKYFRCVIDQETIDELLNE